MRALPVLALAVATLFTHPAWAVLQGATSRDPNGLRRSVVSIENSLGELCSGVIVGPDLVLTAAHCVIDRAAYRVTALTRAFRPQRFNVAALAIHPTFVAGTTPRTQPGIDLAVVKLDRPLGPDFLALNPTQAGRIDVGDGVSLDSADRLFQRQTLAGDLVLVERRPLVVEHVEHPGEFAGDGQRHGAPPLFASASPVKRADAARAMGRTPLPADTVLG